MLSINMEYFRKKLKLKKRIKTQNEEKTQSTKVEKVQTMLKLQSKENAKRRKHKLLTKKKNK